jgi:hypothetical protein
MHDTKIRYGEKKLTYPRVNSAHRSPHDTVDTVTQRLLWRENGVRVPDSPAVGAACAALALPA